VPIFVDLAFSRRLELAEGNSCRLFVDARSGASPGKGATWIEIGGGFALFDGADSPVTQTFGLGVTEPLTERILTEVESFFLERQAPVNHEISPLAGVECFRLLADRGYRPTELASVMYLPIESTPTSDLRIEVRMVSPDKYDTWTQVSAEGWSHDLPEIRDFVLELGQVTARKQNSAAWLACLDGKPIACAAQTIWEGVSHMAGASTIPSARGLGAQLALLTARLRYATERGATSR
jgi:hypothetical protein